VTCALGQQAAHAGGEDGGDFGRALVGSEMIGVGGVVGNGHRCSKKEVDARNDLCFSTGGLPGDLDDRNGAVLILSVNIYGGSRENGCDLISLDSRIG
jgi:hypothetical protein